MRFPSLPRLARLPPASSAAPATARVPGWVHLLWLAVLLLGDGLQLYSRLFDRKAPPLTSLDWQPLLVRAVLTDALASLVFYTNWVILIPRTLGRSRLVPYILGVVGLLLLYVPMRIGVSRLLQSAAESAMPRSWVAYAVPYTVFGLMGIFVSSALKITGEYLLAEQNRRELERQQLLTELSLLKMQVNPHFLFNTLNNIYSLAKQKSDRAPEAVLRLADLMRYMLYESSADTVPLNLELTQLRAFLELQSLRLPGPVTEAIELEAPAELAAAACLVAPMLLLPLVENAFKHGDLTARPAVRILVELITPQQVRFTVSNAQAVDLPALPGQLGGVGLSNLRRRLALLYAGRHQLTITKQAGQHHVQLLLHTT